MPADAPDRRVSLLAKPLMAEILCVEIVHLERGVVHVRRRVRRQEERVMVDGHLAAVDVREERDILGLAFTLGPFGRHVEEVGRRDVERARVPLDLRREVTHAEPEVAQLVHRRGPGREAVEGAHARLMRLVVVDDLLRNRARLGRRRRCLSVDQVHGEAFRVAQRQDRAAARRVDHVDDRARGGG